MTARLLRFFSRGDLVHGRLFECDGTGDPPLLIALTPSGAASDPGVEEIATRFARIAHVASLDLPLCGRRSSEKLTPIAYQAAHPVARRIRRDLEEQISADLAGLAAQIHPAKPRGPTHVLAIGPRAALARAGATALGAGFEELTELDDPALDALEARIAQSPRIS